MRATGEIPPAFIGTSARWKLCSGIVAMHGRQTVALLVQDKCAPQIDLCERSTRTSAGVCATGEGGQDRMMCMSMIVVAAALLEQKGERNSTRNERGLKFLVGAGNMAPIATQLST